MKLWELFVIAVGLSMDAFAVAVCKGLKMPKINYKQTGLIALFFGGFQALMPFIGWLLGKQFESYITSIDHWIAFALLAFLGGKMAYESFKKDEDALESVVTLDLKELTVLAIATSIDALAVGITFAFLGVNIGASVSLIGATTFILSAVGVFIGHKFGAKYKSKAELAGGIILILIGLKILLEHLGIINW
ncbi:MAG: manganese efflux pump [Oscillospiraceae bacterium]|nr:manganese efflux pump [Oscillospiraceae bacterium]